jgi:hypothetical protein
MAVIFFSNGTEYAIGGQSGRPFPKYSINSTSVPVNDGSQIGIKYNIQITGRIIIDGDAEYDDNGVLVNKGAKQNNFHAIILELQSKIESNDNHGKLEITPYGGLPNTLQYDSAKLLSVNIPEQSDESRGLAYTEYTFEFEAYNNTVYPYAIQSVDETIEVTENTDQFTSSGSWESDIYKTYTISHTISAVGIKKYNEGGIATDGDAWRQAELFVRSRLVTPNDLITGSISGSSDVDFNIRKMSGSINGITDLDNNYLYYNHLRVPNCDIAGGSYSITDTWLSSRSPAVVDMEVSSDLDESGITTVNLSGTIEGLNSQSSISNTIQKLSNAEALFNVIDNQAFTIANSAYEQYGDCSSSLQNILISRSIGRNKNSGIITFSYSYNDRPYPSELIIDGKPITTSLSININYESDNEDFIVNKIAIIPLIFNVDGPEIQDMRTRPERRRIIQIDAIMSKCFKNVKPTEYFKPILLRYKPGNVEDGYYVEAFNESFDEILGNYTVNVTWVFK